MLRSQQKFSSNCTIESRKMVSIRSLRVPTSCNLRMRTSPVLMLRAPTTLRASATETAATKTKPPKQGKAAPVQLQPLDVNVQREHLQFYNTMTRRKEAFKTRPEHPDKVQMYVCGVTVYDYSHIGHARVYVAFDILYRLLSKALKYDVQYVRNFTDIDDKIIARANERGEDPLALSGRFIEEFHTDMRLLNCLSPTYEPKATDYIQEMIDSIQKIINNGHAYAVEGGDVYFEVDTLPGYGALSGRQQDDNRAGERVAVDSRKRGPADFALWKGAKPGEPSWPSPWGPGRPGWHIECSAMIHKVMGDTIDIHGGGRDLVFPHHENEIAQARAMQGSCCGVPHAHGDHQHQHEGGDCSTNGPQQEAAFVRYWLHNGFVNVDSEKMSKSLGNFFTIRDVLKSFHPLAMRWFLASTHYRAPVNYSSRALEEASDRLYYVYQSLLDAQAAIAADASGAEHQSKAASQAQANATALSHAVLPHLLDDINTPGALSELSAPLKSINDLLTTKAGKKQADRIEQLATHQQSILHCLSFLGLTPAVPESATTADAMQSLEGVLAEMRSLALSRAGLTEADIQAKIQARADARAAKDFAASDAIRVELAAKGVAIMDTPQGTTWRPTLQS